MNRILIKGVFHYDMENIMLVVGTNSRATIYNKVKSGEIIKVNIMKSAWFRFA
jgi:hypothetical protein